MLSADWIWEQDEELRFTYVSDGIAAATGTTPEALLGRQRLSDRKWRAGDAWPNSRDMVVKKG